MWHRGLMDLARGVAQLVFPNSCLICDLPETDLHEFRHGLCNDCFRAVADDPRPACGRCAFSVGPHVDSTEGCTVCRNASLGFSEAIRLGPYESRLREAVIRMKATGGEPLAEMMGRVLWENQGERLRSLSADLVVPIPLHWRRAWSRGHNQARAIAEEIAVGLGIPCMSRLIRRIRHTPQQVQSSAAARRENVKGAFRINRRASLTGKRILLVDDVMTTGSTLSEAARTLKEAGADSVIVAILARR